jgi:hypothetical protein
MRRHRKLRVQLLSLLLHVLWFNPNNCVRPCWLLLLLLLLLLRRCSLYRARPCCGRILRWR